MQMHLQGLHLKAHHVPAVHVIPAPASRMRKAPLAASAEGEQRVIISYNPGRELLRINKSPTDQSSSKLAPPSQFLMQLQSIHCAGAVESTGGDASTSSSAGRDWDGASLELPDPKTGAPLLPPCMYRMAATGNGTANRDG
jgi:hypothetical protein